MAIHLTFFTSVALAGLAYIVGQILVDHIGVLRRYQMPVPLVGGLLVALVILALRPAGLITDVPTFGDNLDFLVGPLTANMGLHIMPKVLRKSWPLFLLFFILRIVVFFVQLLLALGPALISSRPTLTTALLAGPATFIGAPYNLNPPRYATLLEPAFAAYPNSAPLSKGVSMGASCWSCPWVPS